MASTRRLLSWVSDHAICINRLTADNDSGINSQHEVYEDLGLHTTSVLDRSFNVNNFRCLDMVDDHPNRFLAIECSLSGSVIGDALRNTSHRRSLQNTPGHSGSNSPRSLLSQAPLTESSPLASMDAQSTGIDGPVYECANVGLRSFSPLNEQLCQPDNVFAMPAIEERLSNEADQGKMAGSSDFQFPSWDQLPEEFQNPTSSENLIPTIPISTTGFTMPNVESSADTFMAWDNEDMNFTMDMDMDMDLDMDLSMFDKC
jgi:hypothetical protein